MRRLALILTLLAMPAFAEEANLSLTPHGTPGPVARLALAQRLYARALADGDTPMLLTAIHLARAVTLRPAAGWALQTTGTALPDQTQGASGPPDPAGDGAIALARSLAGDDPDLQDLVYDLDAQLPRARITSASVARSDLAAGQTDTWQMAFFGESYAEIAVLGDGDSGLDVRLTDATGSLICADPAATDQMFCDFVPARNGFFSLTVINTGSVANSYNLITN